MGKDLTGKELGQGFCQRKDGTYCARFTDRFNKRRSLYNKSLAKLKQEYKLALREDLKHDNLKVEYTLDRWYEEWMKAYKHKVRPSTKFHYEQVYTRHISPTLGNKPLNEIKTIDITNLINRLDDDGYSFETKNKVKLILSDMYTRAMADDYALKNPARLVKIKRDELTEPRALTKEEQVEFFDACKGTFYDDAFLVHVLTGLRPGELFALDAWKDIDFKKREITVNKTLVYQKLPGDEQKTFHLGPPKTPQSVRKVKFDARCEIALKNQLRRKHIIAGKETSKPIEGLENLLFVTKYNTPLNAVLYSAAIDRIVNLINESRSEIDKFDTFSGHCFRHTYATRCFEAGVASKTVQAQLGHASLKMTMDLYTHLFDEKKTDEIDKFSAYTEDLFDSSGELALKRYEMSQRVIPFDAAMG